MSKGYLGFLFMDYLSAYNLHVFFGIYFIVFFNVSLYLVAVSLVWFLGL
jgi:hypothetical protein